jgi:hypothetical protein
MKHVALIVSLLTILVGCHDTSDTPHYGPPSVGAADGGTVGAGGGTSSSTGPPTVDAGGADGTSSNAGVGGGPAPIPFVVDDYFVASGYMGDGEVPGAITDANTCPQRAGDKRGSCHEVSWKRGSKGWVGIYWQYPADNWGTMPGRDIDPGATQVSFWAWGAQGGEMVDFFAGMKSHDGFKVQTGSTVLTSKPTQYVMPLQGANYKNVVGAFGWSSETSNGSSPVVFYIDDIQWH